METTPTIHPKLARQFEEAGRAAPHELAGVLAMVSATYEEEDRREERLRSEFARIELEMQQMYLRLLDDHGKLSTILESFSVGLLHTGADWVTLFANSQAEQMLGFKASELVGRNVLEVLEIVESDQATPFDVAACKRTLAEGLPFTSENAHFRRRDGNRIPVFYSVNPVQQETGGAVIVFRDLSAKMSAVAALREAKLEAEAAHRAEKAKNEFLAKISHELRTPMHGILSNARFGEKKTGTVDEGRIRGYFAEILRSGERMMVLLNSLLDLSKLQSGQIELRTTVVDLADLVGSVAAEFATMFDARNLSYRLLGARDCRAEVDEHKIMQVLRNLLSNAVQFTPEGGEIEVGLRSVNGFSEVSVADTGVGIPDGELEDIFGNFVQSSRTRTGAGGTGLGLAICREIIAIHGGKIWAKNRARGGAEFVFVLPASGPNTRRGRKSGRSK